MGEKYKYNTRVGPLFPTAEIFDKKIKENAIKKKYINNKYKNI